ncbi:MAG: NADP-dependent 3-hydroxy acid dehydrogenase YdfG [Thermoproteota archaeon]|jgi:NADP-dependent 3-hydroxy acid dehydrogenase YdfG
MFIGDVVDADFVSDVVSAVGKVDVLVNSAGEV